MVTTLVDATHEHCGGKAGALGALLRAGMPVPAGFVVPLTPDHDDGRAGLQVSYGFRREIDAALWQLGDPPVAVRSSATDEDTARTTAAGQYESTLAVRGGAAVAEAIRACWASASAARVTDYWGRVGGGVHRAAAGMAVLVQRLVDADVSGVMFTATQPGDPTRIEASWGLGLGVVGGTVTPDSYEVSPGGAVRRTIGRKMTRVDRDRELGNGIVTTDVPEHQQISPTLDDATAVALAALGASADRLLGDGQDIEWAIADRTLWVLQARPITAPLPAMSGPSPMPAATSLTGTPGAHGLVTAPARILRSPADFGRARPGEIVICPYTDPAWTPLFTIAAGVVTETGGSLSHAAIIAREYQIPAVLGVPQATSRIRDGAHITVDGTAGTLTLH